MSLSPDTSPFWSLVSWLFSLALGYFLVGFLFFWFYARIYPRPRPQIPFWRSSVPFRPKAALKQSLTTLIVRYPLLAHFDSLRSLAIVELPARITRTYVDQAPFWLKWLPCVIYQFLDILGWSPYIECKGFLSYLIWRRYSTWLAYPSKIGRLIFSEKLVLAMLKQLQPFRSITQRYPWMDEAPCFWVLLLLVKLSFIKSEWLAYPSCYSSNLVRACMQTSYTAVLNTIIPAVHGYSWAIVCTTGSFGIIGCGYRVLDIFMGLQIPTDVCLRHAGRNWWCKFILHFVIQFFVDNTFHRDYGTLLSIGSYFLQYSCRSSWFPVGSTAVKFLKFILIAVQRSTAIGFQFEFKSLQFLATIPPLLFLLLFKHYINKRFANDFQYYIPIFHELSRSIVHSGDADISANKLEERYRNPALQADLFTPMVHPQSMTSLQRIYSGKRGARDGDLARTIDMKSGFKASSNAEPDDEVVEGVKFTPVYEVRIWFIPPHPDDADGCFPFSDRAGVWPRRVHAWSRGSWLRLWLGEFEVFKWQPFIFVSPSGGVRAWLSQWKIRKHFFSWLRIWTGTTYSTPISI